MTNTIIKNGLKYIKYDFMMIKEDINNKLFMIINNSILNSKNQLTSKHHEFIDPIIEIHNNILSKMDHDELLMKLKKHKFLILKNIASEIINKNISINDLINFFSDNGNIYYSAVISKMEKTKQDNDYFRDNGKLNFYVEANKEIYTIKNYYTEGGNSKIYMVQKFLEKEIFILKLITNKNTFKNEMRVMTKVKHKNIIELIDYNKENSFYITKYYKYNLHDYIFVRNKKLLGYEKMTHTFNDILDFMIGINNGLRHMNEKCLFHCDIKADNIFFDNLNNPVIADFGCALAFGDHIDVDSKLGNHMNASPEQRNFQFLHKYERFNLNKTDIYSAGIVFNQLISGKSFEGSSDGRTFSNSQRALDYLSAITNTMTKNNIEERKSFKSVNKYLNYFKNIVNPVIKSIEDLPINKNKIFVSMYYKKYDKKHPLKLKLSYVITKHKNTLIGNIMVDRLTPTPFFPKSFCLKSFVVSNEENILEFYSYNNDLIFMTLNSEKDNFFYVLNMMDIFKHAGELHCESRFHSLEDYNKSYDRKNFFFKKITYKDNSKIIVFGTNHNKNIPIILFSDTEFYYTLPNFDDDCYLDIFKDHKFRNVKDEK